MSGVDDGSARTGSGEGAELALCTGRARSPGSRLRRPHGPRLPRRYDRCPSRAL
jgi:hypothetical protein